MFSSWLSLKACGARGARLEERGWRGKSAVSRIREPAMGYGIEGRKRKEVGLNRESDKDRP